MKLKNINIKAVGAVLLLACAVAVYFFFSTNLSEKTAQFNNENAGLQTEVDYLQDLMNNKQQYIDDTEMMTGEIARIVGEFPADVRPENQIMYVNDLELQNDIVIDSFNMPGKELVPIVAPTSAPAPADDQPIDDTAEPTEETATDDSGEVVPAGGALASSVLLYQSPTTFGFKTTYKSVKEMLKKICEDTQNKKSLNSLTLALDQSTRNLTGTMTLEMYSMDGAGLDYAAPNVNGVTKGTTNIFKSLDNAALLRSTTTAAGELSTSGDAAGTGESADTEGSTTDND